MRIPLEIVLGATLLCALAACGDQEELRVGTDELTIKGTLKAGPGQEVPPSALVSLVWRVEYTTPLVDKARFDSRESYFYNAAEAVAEEGAFELTLATPPPDEATMLGLFGYAFLAVTPQDQPLPSGVIGRRFAERAKFNSPVLGVIGISHHNVIVYRSPYVFPEEGDGWVSRLPFLYSCAELSCGGPQGLEIQPAASCEDLTILLSRGGEPPFGGTCP